MSKKKAKDIALGDFEKGGTVGTTCILRIIIIPVNILFGEGNGNLTPVFLPGKSHGQRSLADNTVHGVQKESDTT